MAMRRGAVRLTIGVGATALAFVGLAVTGSALGGAAAKPAAVAPGTGAASAFTGTWMIRPFGGPSDFLLGAQNKRGAGYVKGFTWVPPAGLTITSIAGSEGGRCTLSNNAISCIGKKGTPPCACPLGGELTVIFYATGLTPTPPTTYNCGTSPTGKTLTRCVCPLDTNAMCNVPWWAGNRGSLTSRPAAAG